MAGLKEILSLPSDIDVNDDDSSEGETQSQMSNHQERSKQFDFALYGGGKISIMRSDALQHPPLEVRNNLLSIYLSNVDAVFKILHAPTVRGYLEHASTCPSTQNADTAVSALLFAVYYAAVMTKTESECEVLFGIGKDVLLDRYRFATEVSLSMADILNSDKLMTLQAFVIYLVSPACGEEFDKA